MTISAIQQEMMKVLAVGLEGRKAHHYPHGENPKRIEQRNKQNCITYRHGPRNRKDGCGTASRMNKLNDQDRIEGTDQ